MWRWRHSIISEIMSAIQLLLQEMTHIYDFKPQFIVFFFSALSPVLSYKYWFSLPLPWIIESLLNIKSVLTWTRPFGCRGWWFTIHWTGRKVFAFTFYFSCSSLSCCWHRLCIRSENLGSSCWRLIWVHQNTTKKVTHFILQMQAHILM
jgi:hypothetical protein